MKPPPKKSKSSAHRAAAPKASRTPHAAAEPEFDGPDEAEEDAGTAAGKKSDDAEYKRQTVTGEAKGFFDTLGDTLRSAGQTAQRYTRIGVSHAEIEKMRFELRAAHAALGEVCMQCWNDAADLGLTARDPAVIQAVKTVKEVRRKIREKESQIAQLKKNAE